MRITVQSPADQPSGANRLIDQIKECLRSDELEEFNLAVAFAKRGPLLKLEEAIDDWTGSGKTIRAAIGIDEKGTSQQALEFAKEHFSETYITHVPRGAYNPTFHPKIYLFKGPNKARAYIGSNNLTVGGLETNLEANVCLELDLPEDKEVFSNLCQAWEDVKSISTPLNDQLLSKLVASGWVMSEQAMRASRATSKSKAKPKESLIGEFPGMKVQPPTSVPAASLKEVTKSKGSPQDTEILERKPSLDVEALAIQIIPHKNGEIFLSKIAIDQNPNFFGFPFEGKTKPKKGGNEPGHQRVPDPIVNISVFDESENQAVRTERFDLNTIYYDKKSEIRITVSQDVITHTPEYSILLISAADEDADYDYDLEIYAPGSEKYKKLIETCNQEMPSGGKSKPRRFGWL